MSNEQFNNKLDDLAKEAARRYSKPFNEAAWSQMESKLDKEDKRRRIIIWWWFMPLLLLIGGGAYYWYLTSANTKGDNIAKKETEQNRTTENITSRHNDATDKTSLTTNEIITLNKTTVPANNDKTVKVNTTSSNTLSAKAENSIITADKKVQENITTNHTIPKRNKIAVDVKPVLSNFKGTQPSIATVNAKRKKKNITLVKATSSSNPMVSSITDDFTKGTPTQANSNDDHTTVIQSNQKTDNNIALPSSPATSIVKSNDTTAKKTDPIVAKKSTPKVDTINNKQIVATKNKKEQTKAKKFDISLILAADNSTDQFKHKGDINATYGIGIAYNISHKLSIATGFEISRKIYSTDTLGYKNYPVIPTWDYYNIDANCLVYDIPLNIQYLVNEHKKSSWYAIAGLSTYIMKKETYNYDYLYYGIPEKYTYDVNNQNKHLFSILNLSAAYRMKINNNYSWQLAPFVKIPLTGIGAGKVSLYSVGLALSLHLGVGK
jgi:hypothetical protein